MKYFVMTLLEQSVIIPIACKGVGLGEGGKMVIGGFVISAFWSLLQPLKISPPMIKTTNSRILWSNFPLYNETFDTVCDWNGTFYLYDSIGSVMAELTLGQGDPHKQQTAEFYEFYKP